MDGLEMLWTFIASLLGSCIALVGFFYAAKRGSFDAVEEAKYHPFWIDESQPTKSEERK